MRNWRLRGADASQLRRSKAEEGGDRRAGGDPRLDDGWPGPIWSSKPKFLNEEATDDQRGRLLV
jgi:hypothetical protein